MLVVTPFIGFRPDECLEEVFVAMTNGISVGEREVAR